MKAEILKLLLQSHADGDEASFRKAALQLASAESTAGHVRLAEDIRALIAKLPATSARRQGPVVDIAQPRGDLADLLEGGTAMSAFATLCSVTSSGTASFASLKRITLARD